MAENENCKHCFAPITKINYILGPQWMHVKPSASFPTKEKGTAWQHCKLSVAEPMKEPNAGTVSAPTEGG